MKRSYGQHIPHYSEVRGMSKTRRESLTKNAPTVIIVRDRSKSSTWWYPVDLAAKKLGVSPQHLYVLACNGLIRAVLMLRLIKQLRNQTYRVVEKSAILGKAIPAQVLGTPHRGTVLLMVDLQSVRERLAVTASLGRTGRRLRVSGKPSKNG